MYNKGCNSYKYPQMKADSLHFDLVFIVELFNFKYMKIKHIGLSLFQGQIMPSAAEPQLAAQTAQIRPLLSLGWLLRP